MIFPHFPRLEPFWSPIGAPWLTVRNNFEGRFADGRTFGYSLCGWSIFLCSVFRIFIFEIDTKRRSYYDVKQKDDKHHVKSRSTSSKVKELIYISGLNLLLARVDLSWLINKLNLLIRINECLFSVSPGHFK